MGTRPKLRKPGLADALFTPVQQRVLALLFGQPGRRFQSAELIRLARGGTGAVHRQLARLSAAGLVTVTRVGNQKHYQANRDSPIFAELHGLVLKTVGLVEPIRQALKELTQDIEVAFIYGSVAEGTDTAKSDIDLMIISESLDHAALYQALRPAESALSRPINPTVMTPKSWSSRLSKRDSFVRRMMEGPRIRLVGIDAGLA